MHRSYCTLFDKNYLFSEKLLASGLVWPALEHCLKCSHLFNILDARGAISVTERVSVIARVRALAVGIAKAWVDQRRGEFPGEEEPVVEKKQKKRAEVVPTTA